jgi:hypothetical protein
MSPSWFTPFRSSKPQPNAKAQAPKPGRKGYRPVLEHPAVEVSRLSDGRTLLSLSFQPTQAGLPTMRTRHIIEAPPEALWLLLEGDSTLPGVPDYSIQVLPTQVESPAAASSAASEGPAIRYQLEQTIEVRRSRQPATLGLSSSNSEALETTQWVSEVTQLLSQASAELTAEQSPPHTQCRYMVSAQGYPLQTIEGFLPLLQWADAEVEAEQLSFQAERGQLCASHQLSLPVAARHIGVRFDGVMGAQCITLQWTDEGFPTGLEGHTIRIVDIQTTPDRVDGTYVMSQINGVEQVQTVA